MANNIAFLEVPAVRRCLWCKERTGAARYWDAGEWVHMINPIHYFGSAHFTDGICDECSNIELAKLLKETENHYATDITHTGNTVAANAVAEAARHTTEPAEQGGGAVAALAGGQSGAARLVSPHASDTGGK